MSRIRIEELAGPVVDLIRSNNNFGVSSNDYRQHRHHRRHHAEMPQGFPEVQVGTPPIVPGDMVRSGRNCGNGYAQQGFNQGFNPQQGYYANQGYNQFQNGYNFNQGYGPYQSGYNFPQQGYYANQGYMNGGFLNGGGGLFNGLLNGGFANGGLSNMSFFANGFNGGGRGCGRGGDNVLPYVAMGIGLIGMLTNNSGRRRSC